MALSIQGRAKKMFQLISHQVTELRKFNPWPYDEAQDKQQKMLHCGFHYDNIEHKLNFHFQFKRYNNYLEN